MNATNASLFGSSLLASMGWGEKHLGKKLSGET
jgi:hypothetical protein